MSCVIDLQQWRHAPQSLSHPAGISLPFEEACHADLLIPEIRSAIARGTHCAYAIRILPAVVRAGERVLVIGSGFGVLSTHLARTPGVEQVIVIEPDIELANYIDRVHSLNAVPWVAVMSAVPVQGKTGRVPLFVRHDVRSSSLSPEDGPWKKIMLIPGVNLELILAEERISLIVAETIRKIEFLLAYRELHSVDTIIVGAQDEHPLDANAELTAHLASHGFTMRRDGDVITFGRATDRLDPQLPAAVSF